MNAGLPDTTESGAPLISLDVARSFALTAGFTEAGLVSLPHANTDRDADRFTHWIHEGRGGSMSYLERTNEVNQLVRARVDVPFPWVRSAVVCMASYHTAQPKSTEPAPEDAGWIARYAWSSRIDSQRGCVPSDYHKVLLKRLKALDANLRERYGEFESRAYVDTGPVVERTLAVAAGLGWSAKNTCLIHPKLGSFAFLGVLLTSLEVERAQAEVNPAPDRCGSCTRCIDACPTGALTAPYQMDARLCISYLTIEHRGAIGPRLMEQMGRQVFGCDICQDVCPWNRKAPITSDGELLARAELVNPLLDWLGSLDEKSFEQAFNGSPIRRAGFNGLRRNIAIAMGNTRSGRFREALLAWADAADEGLRLAARWALAKVHDPA